MNKPAKFASSVMFSVLFAAGYAQHIAIVEPVNGHIKEGRGFRRFLLGGLEKVNSEWSLIATTHNLL